MKGAEARKKEEEKKERTATAKHDDPRSPLHVLYAPSTLYEPELITGVYFLLFQFSWARGGFSNLPWARSIALIPNPIRKDLERGILKGPAMPRGTPRARQTKNYTEKKVRCAGAIYILTKRA